MSFQQRAMIALALCAVIYLIFDFLNPRPPPDETLDGAATQGETGTTETTTAGTEEAKAPEPEVIEEEPPAATPEAAQFEIATHRVESDLLALDLTNHTPHRAGMVADIVMLAEQFAGHDTATDAFNLGDQPTLMVSFADESTDFRVPRGANFEVREASRTRVVLAYKGPEVEIVETLELLGGYEGRLIVDVTNLTAADQGHRMHIRTRIGVGEGSRYDIRRGLCRTGEDLEYEDSSDVEDGPIRYQGNIHWGAVDSKYFLTAVAPEQPMRTCVIEASDDGAYLDNTISSGTATVEAGATQQYVIGLYVGAKELEVLKQFDLIPGVQLEEAIDWGLMGALSEYLGRVLLALMRWFHGLTASWGISILLLTVVVKLLTLPLTLKQMNSMKRMKEIQPEIQKIKEKYGDDRVKQGQEMQALFGRSGVNPLAGCLPMVVQMPIWFALYSMLSTTVELVHVPFLWLPDLTAQDPYFALPLALGGIMLVNSKLSMTQGAMDATQAKMMQWVMPIMFTVFMLFLPSGLAVYIFANTVLSVIQTIIQVKPFQKAEAAK